MSQFIIDTLLINGNIYTMREEGERAEAVGIRDGRIVFVGNLNDSADYTAVKTIDLRGKTVIPGLGDSHLHLYAYCQNQATVQLESAASMDEMIATMKKKASVTEKGRWVKGTGFDHTKFAENRMPTRWDLDRISTDHPIVIRRCCLHIMVANSLAIETAGIGPELPAELKGLIEKDQSGELNGVFREKATAIFDDIVPNPLSDPDEKKRIMTETFHDMVSKGLTSVHTYAAKIWNYEEDINLYRALDRSGELPLRVLVNLDELFEPEEKPNGKDPFLKSGMGAYKLFTDGSFGAGTAALREPYSDDPENSGVSVDPERLTNEIRKAFSKGLQPAIHAIGDRALDLAMDAIESVLKEGHKPESLPVRIIHAQLVRSDQLVRLKTLPVVLDVQPIFLCTDLHWIESRLGEERVRDSYLWKTLAESGLTLAGGSDCPVESYDPIEGIYAAVTRQDLSGFPPGGFLPAEKVTVYEAICMFTKNIAYATGTENVLGTIEPGKFADLTVLDEDPFRIEPERLRYPGIHDLCCRGKGLRKFFPTEVKRDKIKERKTDSKVAA